MRTNLYQLRKVYKSLCRKLKRIHDQHLIEKLETFKQQTLIASGTYWQKINIIQRRLTPLDEMQDHYMKLLQKQNLGIN